MAKVRCPISRDEFMQEAALTMPVQIDGKSFDADKKHFSTRSLGYYLATKGYMEVAGKKCGVQIQVTITIIDSKNLPDDTDLADVAE